MAFIRILSFILIIFSRWHQQEASAHECSPTVPVCEEEFENLKAYRSRYRFVSDDETLTEMCKLQDLALKCVNAFAEDCLPEEDQQVFKTLTKGSDAYFDEFCLEKGALRLKYLQYSECIKSVTPRLDECAKRYETSQKYLDENEGDSRTLKFRTCCIYAENIHCSSNATWEMCGLEAAQLVSELWQLLGGSYLNEVCHPLSGYDTRDCPLDSHSTRLPEQRTFMNLVLSLLCSYALFRRGLHS